MPFTCTAVRILIASPGDVNEEREIVKGTVESWNTLRSRTTGVVFLPLMWELHTIPEQGAHPQAIVNKQIVEQADALIAVFWTRLGTPTGIAESGTAEEIKQLKAAGKHVAIYFSKRHIDPYKNDQTEFARLCEFRKWCSTDGLINEFTDHSDFKEKLLYLLDTLTAKFRPQGGIEPPNRVIVTHDATLREELKRYMARAAAAWQVERDSQPPKVDDAKRIIRGIGDTLVRIVTSLDTPKPDEHTLVMKIATEARNIEQYQIYLDGGRSYHEFWKIGDDLVMRAQGIAQ